MGTRILSTANCNQKKPAYKSRFKKWRKNLQNSHFSFVRIFILEENMLLRNSPLHEAAERCEKCPRTYEHLAANRQLSTLEQLNKVLCYIITFF